LIDKTLEPPVRGGIDPATASLSGISLPHGVQIAVLGSAALSLAGGSFAILYLLVAARTMPSVMAGACATLLNIGYFCWFIAGLSASPP
jgi:hypothetical protein